MSSSLSGDERQKEVEGLKTALEEKDKEVEELRGELQEVSQRLEETRGEADDSMNKYCSLMVQVHRLEEANEALSTRLAHVTAASSRPPGRKSSRSQGANSENKAPTTPPRSPQGSSPGKRAHAHISDREGAQEALHDLTKKLRAKAEATPRPRPEANDQFRPEGLPELVQKGM